MKFVCLGYSDEKLWDAMSESEREAMIEECFAYDDVLRNVLAPGGMLTNMVKDFLKTADGQEAVWTVPFKRLPSCTNWTARFCSWHRSRHRT